MVTGQWNLIGNGSYTPTAQDLAGQSLLQGIWRTFLAEQTLENSEYGWQPVNVAADYVQQHYNSKSLYYGNYTIFVIAEDGSQSVKNHHINVCSLYDEVGLDREKFWWAN